MGEGGRTRRVEISRRMSITSCAARRLEARVDIVVVVVVVVFSGGMWQIWRGWDKEAGMWVRVLGIAA